MQPQPYQRWLDTARVGLDLADKLVTAMVQAQHAGLATGALVRPAPQITPDPVGFYVPDGCAWCAMGGELSRAYAFLDRGIDRPQFAVFYAQNKVLPILNQVRRSIATLGGAFLDIGLPLTQMQAALNNPTPMVLTTARMNIASLIDWSFDCAETAHPNPMPAVPNMTPYPVVATPITSEGGFNGSTGPALVAAGADTGADHTATDSHGLRDAGTDTAS